MPFDARRHIQVDTDGYELTRDQLDQRTCYKDPYEEQSHELLAVYSDSGLFRVKEPGGVIAALFRLLRPHPSVFLLLWYRDGLLVQEYDADEQVTITYQRAERKVVFIHHQEPPTRDELSWTPPPSRQSHP